MTKADARPEDRDEGPYVTSLRDVELPADLASALTRDATVGNMLDALAIRLGGANGLPARQEARDLIAAVLNQPRFWPSAHLDDLLTPAHR